MNKNLFLKYVKQSLVYFKNSYVLVFLIWTSFFSVGFFGFFKFDYHNDNIFSNRFVSRSDLFFLILKNNVSVIFLNISGLFTFSVSSFLYLIINSLTTGFYFYNYSQKLGVMKTFSCTYPHIIEYVGVIISSSIGFQGFKYGIRLLKKDNKFISKQEFVFIIINFTLSLFIILIAAILEAYISIKL